MFVDQVRAAPASGPCTLQSRPTAGTELLRPPHPRQFGSADRRTEAPPPDACTVEALRFAVTGSVELRATDGIVLADMFHRLVVRQLDGGRAEVIGHAGTATDHTHAHWVPLGDGERITALLVWVPVGLSTAEVAAFLTAALHGVPLREGGRRAGSTRPFRLRLDLESAGPIAVVAPELCGPARVWRSLTPYLPVRHRKRADLVAYLAEDVRYELAYRSRPPAVVHRLGPLDAEVDPWASTFRRQRPKEGLRRRPGYRLRLAFEEPEAGPLMLGQLSHFGFGVFVPEGGDR
ncbi:MAG: type I-U CRISPR-associated protein Csb2 [Micromonosporaceae bacterium]